MKTLNKKLNLNKLIIFSDFDSTMTYHYNPYNDSILHNSISLFENSTRLSSQFIEKRSELYNKYYKFEKEETKNMNLQRRKDLLTKWYQEYDYFIRQETFEFNPIDLNVVLIDNIKRNIIVREGVKEFLMFIYSNNIPFYIVSAGFSNTIEKIMDFYYHDEVLNLKSKGLYNIIANEIVIEERNKVNYIKYIGYRNENSKVTVLNKGDIIKESLILDLYKERKDYIVIGDNINDKLILEYSNGNNYYIGISNNSNTNQEFISSFDYCINRNDSFSLIINHINSI